MNFTVGVGCSVCANGETWEFWLTLNERRVPDTEIFITPTKSQPLEVHAAAAIREIFQKVPKHVQDRAFR